VYPYVYDLQLDPRISVSGARIGIDKVANSISGIPPVPMKVAWYQFGLLAAPTCEECLIKYAAWDVIALMKIMDRKIEDWVRQCDDGHLSVDVAGWRLHRPSETLVTAAKNLNCGSSSR